MQKISGDVVRLLKTAEPTKPNLTHIERQALLGLRRDENLLVLKSDKGNVAVILQGLPSKND